MAGVPSAVAWEDGKRDTDGRSARSQRRAAHGRPLVVFEALNGASQLAVAKLTTANSPHRMDSDVRETLSGNPPRVESELAVRPNDAVTLWVLGFVLIEDGQPEQAIPVLEKAVSVSHESAGITGTLVAAYAHAGRRTDALRSLASLQARHQKGYVPAAAFIPAYLGLGDYDQAFVWFERAYQEQSNILQFLKVHPLFDPVRGDPRFQDLLHRVGLEQAK